MRAAVCREFSAPLLIEEVVLSPPEAGEVRVQLKASAVCGSDIHAANGAWGGDLPVVFGHEASGIVAELGEGVHSLALGDHVVVSLIRDCGACFFCARGQSYLCEHDWAKHGRPRIHAVDGQTIHQGIYVGGFADEVVVYQEQCAAVPSDMPFDSACLLACGVITGYGAVTNTVAVEAGASVGVIGAGGVGLNAIQAASLNGAGLVVAIDTAPEKLEAAKRFGATNSFDARHAATANGVAELTKGLGLDYVFVTVGAPAAVEQAMSLARKGGTVVIVGIGAVDTYGRIELSEFASGERTIVGSKMGSSVLRRDVPALVDRYRTGDLLLDELITGRYPLDRINEAIADVVLGSTIRNVVVFE